MESRRRQYTNRHAYLTKNLEIQSHLIMQGDREFDYIVFGASGFTGQFIAYRLAELQKKNKKLTFAIAGRSSTKLQPVVDKLKNEYDCELGKKNIILADVKKMDLMVAMTKRCKILITAVGPFRNYGEPVVQACLQTSTHYVDICGEPEFVEKMVLKYYEEAKEKGLMMVSSCGMDSVPADFGTFFCENYFAKQGGTCEKVTLYHEMQHNPDIGYFTPTGNAATYIAIIESISNQHKLKQIRNELSEKEFLSDYKTIKREGNKPKIEKSWFQSERSGKHSIKFMGADSAIVRLGQRIRDKQIKDAFGFERAFPYFACYMAVDTWFRKIVFTLFGLVLFILSGFSFIRPYMIKYPKYFSLFQFTDEPIDQELLKKCAINFVFEATGTINDERKSYLVRASIIDPGYSRTARLAVACAETILNDYEMIRKGNKETRVPPVYGGCLTPSVAFGSTKILGRLKDADLDFTVTEASTIY